MAVINAVRYSDGRTVYNCRNSPYAPTNPKAGTPFSGNTVVWDANTRAATVFVPRQQDDYFKSMPVRSEGSAYSVARKSVLLQQLPCDAPNPGLCKQTYIPQRKSIASRFPNQYSSKQSVPFAK